jgi:FMN-dependent NADH-azoreductase
MNAMKKILFINACVRPNSRTSELADCVLENLCGTAEEIKLYEMELSPLTLKGMELRGKAAEVKDFSDGIFDLPKQFAQADVIVIAAPYWDMMFPSVLKIYLENITVSGITFRYSDQGRPESLCKAKELYYVATAGGFIGQNDFGFSYVQAVAQTFFGITQIHRYTAEGLDIFGTDVEKVMLQAKREIATQW